jgi:hypothetical protein
MCKISASSIPYVAKWLLTQHFKKVHNFEIKRTKSDHILTHEGGHITMTMPE